MRTLSPLSIQVINSAQLIALRVAFIQSHITDMIESAVQGLSSKEKNNFKNLIVTGG